MHEFFFYIYVVSKGCTNGIKTISVRDRRNESIKIHNREYLSLGEVTHAQDIFFTAIEWST